MSSLGEKITAKQKDQVVIKHTYTYICCFVIDISFACKGKGRPTAQRCESRTGESA